MGTSLELHIPAARRVLDFGCGTGWVLGRAAKENAPECIGIDFSFSQLQEAQRQYGGGAAFVQADGLRLPFREGTFDVVIGHVSMPYMNTRIGLAEVARVLVPGGSLFLTFHSYYSLRQ